MPPQHEIGPGQRWLGPVAVKIRSFCDGRAVRFRPGTNVAGWQQWTPSDVRATNQQCTAPQKAPSDTFFRCSNGDPISGHFFGHKEKGT